MISQNPETKFNSYLILGSTNLVLPPSSELHDTGCKERKLCNIKIKTKINSKTKIGLMSLPFTEIPQVVSLGDRSTNTSERRKVSVQAAIGYTEW